MDLILFQPGIKDIITDQDKNGNSTYIDNEWRQDILDLGMCMELVSVHHGMKQQITTDVSNKARTSGRPIITEFTCVKYVDQTSVKLYDYCLRAAVLDDDNSGPSKLYIARNSGDKTANIITIELRNALISEIQFQSHPNDMPTEQFKLNFTEVLWTYTLQDREVKTPGNVRAGWSVMRNRPIGKFT